jgi:predicted HD superfamily hydrolase involved in NAD metabolism
MSHANGDASVSPEARRAFPLRELVLTADQRRLLTRATDAVTARITGKRLLHSLSVADTAQSLAERYGADPCLARLAGLLHDWDKQLPEEELLGLAREYGIVLPAGYVRETVPLLHAWTGARSVAAAFPDIPEQVPRAISRHTTGAIDMTVLDKVVYLADAIEPRRSYDLAGKLRSEVGARSLDQIYADAQEQAIVLLARRHRYIYPGAIDAWNALLRDRTDRA